MSRLSLRTLGAVCLVASAIALPTLTVAQQDDADFKRGLGARSDGKWPAVVEAMRKAIQVERRESTRKVRRNVLDIGGTEYFPDHFLGEALKKQNDCAGAVKEWETSEDQKAVQTNREFWANILAGYKECAAKGVLLRGEYQQQLALTDQVYRDALVIAERVRKVETSNPDLWRPEVNAEFERVRSEFQAAYSRLEKGKDTRLSTDFAESRNASARAVQLLKPLETRLSAAISNLAVVQGQSKEVLQIILAAEETDRAIDATKVTLTPELAESRTGARGNVANARVRLGVAEKTQNAAAAAEAQGLARNASDALSKVLEGVRKLAGEQLLLAVSTAEQEFSFLDATIGRLNQLFAEKPQMVKPEMTAQRDSLQKDLTAARRRFDSARKTESVQGVQDAVRLASEARMRLDALITIFVPLTLRDRGVVAALEDGARYYLDGQYQKALDALGPSGQLTNVLLQVHVHVFRAASLYALYVSSGQSNQALRDQASAEVQRSREIDPAFRPSRRAFTPRFITFYEAGAAPATSSPTAPAPTQ